MLFLSKYDAELELELQFINPIPNKLYYYLFLVNFLT